VIKLKTAGIIAEYNPLHNGHLHHIQETKARTGCDYIIVAMSGDFVQRGEPAIADKFTRAQWALTAGADLVLELPAVYAVSSAERFAYGGVKTLADTGVLDCLSFGSELTDIGTLTGASESLQHTPAGFERALKEQLALGKSFPRARYDALAACGASKEVLSALRTPNSILAVEYIRFLNKLAPEAEPVAVARRGADHDSLAVSGEFASASAIREAILTGDRAAYSAMPMYVAGRFGMGGVAPVSLAEAGQLIRYALLSMTPEELKALPDVQEGLENVLYRAVRQTDTLEGLFAALKSKRYTLARCRRIAIYALLGFNQSLLKTAMEEDCGYLRVLGFRRQARPLLGAIGKQGKAPLLMRRADIARCSPAAVRLLNADIHAHDVYRMLLGPESPIRDFDGPPVTV